MNNKTGFLIIIILLFISNYTSGQCAMCKSVVEANLEAGGTSGAGLNNGILYLMAIPYITILVFAIFYYYQNKSKVSSL